MPTGRAWIAAPVACYLAGRTGVDPVEALAQARRLADPEPP
jgi:hypothetical protein